MYVKVDTQRRDNPEAISLSVNLHVFYSVLLLAADVSMRTDVSIS